MLDYLKYPIVGVFNILDNLFVEYNYMKLNILLLILKLMAAPSSGVFFMINAQMKVSSYKTHVQIIFSSKTKWKKMS